MQRPKRLLTIGHSYAADMSRRLPNEMAKIAGDEWDVVAVGPSFYHGNPKHGDLEPAHLIVKGDERAAIAGMPMFLTQNSHVAFWGSSVARLMRRRFDVVHAWAEPFNLSCFQIARTCRPESAFCFYTFQNISKRYPPPFSAFERATVARADGWIAAGGLVERTLASRPLYRDRPYRRLGLGVDVDQFTPDPIARAALRDEFGWDDACVGIVYLGRFVEAKGLPIMMRALDRVEGPWRALFIGSGELEGDLAAWSSKHAGRVTVRRNLSHGDVARHLSAGDVLCAPSRTTPIWREQFGRMLIEAFATGLAVVASDSGEIPTVVGDAGIVVPERDEQAWFATLARVVADEAERKRLGERGLARARSKFAWSVIAREHLDFFQELSERRSFELMKLEGTRRAAAIASP